MHSILSTLCILLMCIRLSTEEGIPAHAQTHASGAFAALRARKACSQDKRQPCNTADSQEVQSESLRLNGNEGTPKHRSFHPQPVQRVQARMKEGLADEERWSRHKTRSFGPRLGERGQPIRKAPKERGTTQSTPVHDSLKTGKQSGYMDGLQGEADTSSLPDSAQYQDNRIGEWDWKGMHKRNIDPALDGHESEPDSQASDWSFGEAGVREEDLIDACTTGLLDRVMEAKQLGIDPQKAAEADLSLVEKALGPDVLKEREPPELQAAKEADDGKLYKVQYDPWAPLENEDDAEEEGDDDAKIPVRNPIQEARKAMGLT